MSNVCIYIFEIKNGSKDFYEICFMGVFGGEKCIDLISGNTHFFQFSEQSYTYGTISLLIH